MCSKTHQLCSKTHLKTCQILGKRKTHLKVCFGTQLGVSQNTPKACQILDKKGVLFEDTFFKSALYWLVHFCSTIFVAKIYKNKSFIDPRNVGKHVQLYEEVEKCVCGFESLCSHISVLYFCY